VSSGERRRGTKGISPIWGVRKGGKKKKTKVCNTRGVSKKKKKERATEGEGNTMCSKDMIVHSEQEKKGVAEKKRRIENHKLKKKKKKLRGSLPTRCGFRQAEGKGWSKKGKGGGLSFAAEEKKIGQPQETEGF